MLDLFSESGESLKRVWGYPVTSKGEERIVNR